MTTTSMQEIFVYLQRYRATSFGKKCLTYFIGSKNIENVKPLCTMLAKIIEYRIDVTINKPTTEWNNPSIWQRAILETHTEDFN